MQTYLDLLRLKGDGALVLIGPLFSNIVETERSVLHVHGEEGANGVSVRNVKSTCKKTSTLATKHYRRPRFQFCADRKQEISGITEAGRIELGYASINLWTKERGLLFKDRNMFESCEHPLARRTWKVAYNGVSPYIQK